MSYHGREGSVYLGPEAAVAEVTDFEYDEAVDLAEDTAKGDTNKTRKVDHKDGGGTITCHFDPTDADGQAELQAGETVTLTLYPNDADGDVQLSGSVIIEGRGIKSPLSGITDATYRFKGVLKEETI